MRILLIPLILAIFIIGLITGKWLIFGIIGIALLIFTSLFYSHRKQRVRYWIQGYKTHLENNKGDKKAAIETIQKEFCLSKYADDSTCNNDYQDIGALVEDIIEREFKFDILLQPPVDLSAYRKAKENVKHEIDGVEKEILG